MSASPPNPCPYMSVAECGGAECVHVTLCRQFSGVNVRKVTSKKGRPCWALGADIYSLLPALGL